MKKDSLVTVAQFLYVYRAYMVKAWLEAAGIESYVIDEGIRSVLSASDPYGVQVKVREEDVENALDIIDSINLKYGPEESNPQMPIQPISKILVPVDFSEHSLNAAEYALDIASKRSATVYLLHIYFNPALSPLGYDNTYSYPSNVTDAMEDIRERAGQQMEELKGKLESYLERNQYENVSMETELIGGIAEDSILVYADEMNCNLIVMGSRGKALADFWYGSVTAMIVEKARIPVLVVPKESTYRHDMIRNVAYATDFDDSDGLALQKLVSIIHPFHSHIYVVHFESEEETESPWVKHDKKVFRKKYLENIENVEVDFKSVKSDNALNSLDQIVQEKSIDIISITTHKRRLIEKMFHRSRAKELVFHATVPLLVFHA